MTVTASALDWLLDSDEPGIVFQAKRDLLGEADPPEAAPRPRGPEGTGAPRRAAARRRLRRQRLRQVGRRALAARLARRARRPRRRAPLRRGRRDRARVADRQGPPEPDPDDRRARPPVRLAGGERARRLLPARARGRPARSAARGVARRVAVAGRRLELRQEGDRLPLLVQRVAAADVGSARVLGRHRGDQRRRTLPSARRSSCSSIGCFARSRPASRSALVRHDAPAAVLALRLLPALGRARADGPGAATRGRPTGSSCWRSAGSPTAAGAPAGAGGSRRARREATSRSSTGARARASC